MTYDNFIVIQPNSHTHALSAFFHSHPRGTGKKSDTHRSLSPFFLMHHVASVSPLSWSATNFFLFFPATMHVAQSKSPRHTALSVVDRIFFSHATSWQRAKLINTPLYWSSTEFLSFPRHLVAQSKCPPATHCSISPRPNFLPFPRHFVAQQKSVTHHSIGSRPKPIFLNGNLRHFMAQSKRFVSCLNYAIGPRPRQATPQTI